MPKQIGPDLRMLETGSDLLAACSNQVFVRGVVTTSFDFVGDCDNDNFEIWAIAFDPSTPNYPEERTLVQLRYRELPSLMCFENTTDRLEVRVQSSRPLIELEREAEVILGTWRKDERGFPVWWFRKDPIIVAAAGLTMNQGGALNRDRLKLVDPSNAVFLIEYHRMYDQLWRDSAGSRRNIPGFMLRRFCSFVAHQRERFLNAQSVNQVIARA